MALVSRFLRSVSDADGRHGLGHWCPACEEVHVFWTKGFERGNPGPVWTFNERPNAPSFNPSMKITDDECCHYFLKLGHEFDPDGKQNLTRDLPYLQYCPDSTHGMKGHTILLPDLPAALQGAERPE